MLMNNLMNFVDMIQHALMEIIIIYITTLQLKVTN